MPLRRFLHIFRLGLRNIALHRLRSSLTIMGIVLGVASVVVMLAVGEAARYEAVQQLKELGATNIIIRSVKPSVDRKENRDRFLLEYGLRGKDLERILETIPTVITATPMREYRKDIRCGNRKLEGRVVAVLPAYFEMNLLHMNVGRFIDDRDNAKVANVCVLAAETAETLFPTLDPLGRSVLVEGHAFQVVGVTERRAPSAGIGGSLGPQEFNRDIYIPFQTDKTRFGKTVTYYRAGNYQAEKLEISQITVTVDQMENVRQTATIIESVLDQFHPDKDTAVTVPLDLLERAEQTQRVFTLVLGAIASISLLVGGIGIMNIMLATVTERTREIGIRRALGAKRRDIIWQFLVETIALSNTGGLIGILLGVGFSYLVTYLFGLRTIINPWSPALAFAVSVGVGLIFGLYPARRAAMLDPIEALRHE